MPAATADGGAGGGNDGAHRGALAPRERGTRTTQLDRGAHDAGRPAHTARAHRPRWLLRTAARRDVDRTLGPPDTESDCGDRRRAEGGRAAHARTARRPQHRQSGMHRPLRGGAAGHADGATRCRNRRRQVSRRRARRPRTPGSTWRDAASWQHRLATATRRGAATPHGEAAARARPAGRPAARHGVGAQRRAARRVPCRPKLRLHVR